jgi:ABC-type uncharacterized transport system involved in gliding motility auxiliary subunit
MARIFNIIGWIGTALVVAALGLMAFATFRTPTIAGLDQYARYLAWGGLACMALYIASQWREIFAFFGGRQARYGTLAATSVLIFLGILVAVNYIGAQQHKRWDLTSAKQFSLSDQSRNVVAGLDAPLQILVFDREDQVQPTRDRLQEYAFVSPQVKPEYVDPDREPARAEPFQLKQYGTLILNYKDRSERITTNTEQDITGAIIKLVSGQQRKIYFTAGHGEKDINTRERDGYQGAAEGLKRENYGVETLVLAQRGAVPDDASAVIVAGPKSDFFPPEIEAIKTYLGKGGKLLLLIDPPDRPESPPQPNLIALARDWGITLGENIVVDVSGMGQLFGQSEAVPIAATYPSHPATQRFRTLTAYPIARSVDPVQGGVNGHNAESIVQTSPQSWAETDFKALSTGGQIRMDEGKDLPGPISLAAAVMAPVTATPAPADNPDAPKPETRVVVFGDSDFAGPSMAGISGNLDMFLNVVGWLSQQENLISIRPKQADDRRLEAIPARTQMWLFYTAWLAVPLMVIGVGAARWWRKG